MRQALYGLSQSRSYSSPVKTIQPTQNLLKSSATKQATQPLQVKRVVPQQQQQQAVQFQQVVPQLRPPKKSGKEAYEAIHPNATLPGYQLHDHPETVEKDGTRVRTTRITAPSGHVGSVTRAWNDQTKTFELRSAFLDKIPKEHRTVSYGGRQMRLHDFATQRQARGFGIGYGEVANAKMSTIQNIRTIAQMTKAAREGTPASTAVKGTQSYEYGTRVLGAMGHTVKDVDVKGGHATKFDDLLKHYETHGGQRWFRDKEIAKRHDEILSAAKVGRYDKVKWDFDINLGLAPDKSGE